MKALKLFFVVVFFTLMASFLANAQGNKSENCSTFPYAGLIPCVDEYVVGTVTQCYTLWDSDTRLQMKIRGTYIGKSGKIYEMNQIENYKRKDPDHGKADNKITVFNGVVTSQGIPVAIMKFIVHMVWDANGELKCEIEKGTIGWECL